MGRTSHENQHLMEITRKQCFKVSKKNRDDLDGLGEGGKECFLSNTSPSERTASRLFPSLGVAAPQKYT